MNEKPGRMKTSLIVGAVLFAGAFLLGFIPQYRNASGLQDELRVRDQQISQLQREARLSKAKELASLTYLELARKNYGTAGQHASAFFDHLGTLGKDAPPQWKSEVDAILSQRDAVTGNIAKPDPAVETSMRDILDRLHQLRAQ